MAYEKLAKLARKSIGEQFYQSAYAIKDDRNYFDYMEDDYDDEFDTHQEFADCAEEVFQLLHDINFYQNMIEFNKWIKLQFPDDYYSNVFRSSSRKI